MVALAAVVVVDGGAHTLSWRQSSSMGRIALVCGHMGPNCVPSRTVGHGVGGRAGAKRSCPTGGSAKGMLRDSTTPLDKTLERTLPSFVWMMVAEGKEVVVWRSERRRRQFIFLKFFSVEIFIFTTLM